jgi:predicted kinase
MEAVILIGLPAAGKSTFYQQRFLGTHVRINLDMLKTRRREAVFVDRCLQTRQSFVVDNTNITVTDRARYIRPAKAAGFRVIGYYFSSGVKDCLARNAQRSDRQRVPPPALYRAIRRLEIPRMEEGFDELYEVQPNGEGGFVVERLHVDPIPRRKSGAVK